MIYVRFLAFLQRLLLPKRELTCHITERATQVVHGGQSGCPTSTNLSATFFG